MFKIIIKNINLINKYVLNNKQYYNNYLLHKEIK